METGDRSSRRISMLGAPSAIGIRPYDDGTLRRLDRAPDALRAEDLAARLGARDDGDVIPPPYIDFSRPPGRPRDEAGVAGYSRELAGRVAGAAGDGSFLLVLGGDCSIVLGCLLGVRRTGRGRVGLAYLDAHADFATPEQSRTGSAASMCLGLAVGRGETPLAQLDGHRPLVRAEDVVAIGRREVGDRAWYGEAELRALPVLDVPDAVLRRDGPRATAASALGRLARPDLDGFWIHLDADVLDPRVMPAVDSPEPGGPGLEDLAALLGPLVRHPRAIGLELTIYDPALDPDRSCAARLAGLLQRVLAEEVPA